MMSSIATISTRSPPGWEENASWTAATLTERAVLEDYLSEADIRCDEDNLPSYSITGFKKLVYNVGSQEPRDTSDLCIYEGNRNRVESCLEIRTRTSG